jgi:L-2,4-diaminobutyric acid acetyltransferase
MNRPIKCRVPIGIRKPRIDDITAIVAVVEDCAPYLTAHSSYIPWIYTQFYFETCAVAEMDGEIVGWCSIIPVPRGYFLHQLGVAAKARRKGIARAMLTHQLQRLALHEKTFALQFTVDRRNAAVLDLNRSIADHLGMQVVKKPGVLPLVEDSEEELYMMIPQKAEGGGPDFECSGVMAGAA